MRGRALSADALRVAKILRDVDPDIRLAPAFARALGRPQEPVHAAPVGTGDDDLRHGQFDAGVCTACGQPMNGGDPREHTCAAASNCP